MTPEEINGLTLYQFQARMKDVGVIENMKNGEGKGRVKRSPEVVREAIERRGLKAPKKL